MRANSASGVEAVLVAAVACGDRDALAKLYDRYATMVFNVALRYVREPEIASDILQDVFWALPASISSYAGTGAFDAWLRKVAARYALMSLRRTERRREVSSDEAFVRTRPDDVFNRIDLERALQTLDPDYRDVFLLKVVDGFSHDEIAALLNISVGNSRARLFRARSALRKLLNDD